MTIVSGIATATGVSPLLNAPREADPVAKPAADRNAQSVASPNLSRIASATQTTRPVLGVSDPGTSDAPVNFKPSRDSRYVLFAKAVRALRLDPETTRLSKAQLTELMAAARDVFMLDDGVPREVRPPAVRTPLERAERISEERNQRTERAEETRRAEFVESERRAEKNAEARKDRLESASDRMAVASERTKVQTDDPSYSAISAEERGGTGRSDTAEHLRTTNPAAGQVDPQFQPILPDLPDAASRDGQFQPVDDVIQPDSTTNKVLEDA